jgi:hypothetical protein
MPPDFPAMFVELGWEAIEDHYGTNQRAIRRWLREAGEADLIGRRRGYLRRMYAARGMTAIPGPKPGARLGLTEMRVTDPALQFLPIRRLRSRWTPTNERF